MSDLSVPTIHASVAAYAARALSGVIDAAIWHKAMRRVGLSAQSIEDPQGTIPLRIFVALLENVAELSGDKLIGARLGQNFSPMDLGPLGLIFFSSQSLGEVFREYTRYSLLIQKSTLFSLEDFDGLTYCMYNVLDGGIRQRRQDNEFSLASLASMIRHVLGRNWRPAEVHFEHMGHDDDRALSRIFNAPVSFGHSTNRLIIHTDDLKRTNTHYNASMVPFVQRYLFDLLEAENVTKTCTELVQLAVAKRMGERAVDVRAVAGDLGMSSRALQRHLADEGTTFRAIVAAYRRDVASRLLGKGGLPITAVAHNLGYADGAVLARSFKAWTGSTPRQFARQKAR